MQATLAALQTGQSTPAFAGANLRNERLADPKFLGYNPLQFRAAGNFENLFITQLASCEAFIASDPFGALKTVGNRPLICVESIPKHSLVHAQIARPCCQGLTFPLVSDLNVTSPIVVLLHYGGPLYVTGSVVPIGVYPLKAHVLRSRAKNGQKSLKRSQRRIDTDTTASVILKRHILRIEASLHHASPTPIFRPYFCHNNAVGGLDVAAPAPASPGERSVGAESARRSL